MNQDDVDPATPALDVATPWAAQATPAGPWHVDNQHEVLPPAPSAQKAAGAGGSALKLEEDYNMPTSNPSAATVIGRGAVAGVAGTLVMTAFQKLVEMPITGRPDSYVPAEVAEKVLGVKPSTPEGRKRLNYAAHTALGAMWGAAYGVAALRGLRGQKAAHAVFAAVYPTDVAMTAALGVSDPRQWSTQDWVIDSVEKYIEAQATSAIFDRALDPARPVSS